MTSRPDGRARVRGAFVGAASGASSIAAHGLGGGVMMPNQAALVLLLVVSVMVGVGVAVLGERSERVPLSAVLVLGQILGHSILTIASEHHHGPVLTPTMLGAHVMATVLCAVLIRAAVVGHGHALSVLRRILPVLTLPLRVPEFGTEVPQYRPDIVLRLMVRTGIVTRGPPRPARVHLFPSEAALCPA